MFILFSGLNDSTLILNLSRRKRILLFSSGIQIYVSPKQIDTFDKERVRKALRYVKLECIGCTCLEAETDVSSQDEAIRKRGICHLQKCAELFSGLGAKLVSGVTYGAWGKLTGTGRTKKEWVRSVESLKEACRLAC